MYLSMALWIVDAKSLSSVYKYLDEVSKKAENIQILHFSRNKISMQTKYKKVSTSSLHERTISIM
ncbi:hypothetical protein ACJIZ3_023715 [Penstemon smallii]|uniref:Uncharacterized protein n=1 Tax=Penstemon smallii TaxID=265156 RepID=A0ABD3TPU2_9LAMI